MAALAPTVLLAAACSSTSGPPSSTAPTVRTTTTNSQSDFVGGGSLPTSIGALAGIACTSVRHCVVVGHGVAFTSNGGASWVAGQLPPGLGANVSFGSVTCPSAMNCMAGGDGADGSVAIYSIDGGAVWSESSLPSGPGLNGISCPSADECFGIGSGVLLVSTDNGTSWSGGTDYVASDSDAISCASTQNCVAVAPYDTNTGVSAAAFTADGGESWIGGKVPSGVHDLVSVTCPTAQSCIAVGENAVNSCTADGCKSLGTQTAAIETTKDGGSSWTLVAAPAASIELRSVWCVTSRRCIAVGNGDGLSAIVSTDGGASWSNAFVKAGTTASVLLDVSCPSSTECVGAGGTGSDGEEPAVAFTSNGGSTWQS